MIEVQCTSCHTRYRIDEQVLPEGTPTFKCSRCGHVFSFEPRKSRVEGATRAANVKAAAPVQSSLASPPSPAPINQTPRLRDAAQNAERHPQSKPALDAAEKASIANPESPAKSSTAASELPTPEAEAPTAPARSPELQAGGHNPVEGQPATPPDTPVAQQAKAKQAEQFYNRLFGEAQTESDQSENLSFDFADEQPAPDQAKFAAKPRSEPLPPIPPEPDSWEMNPPEPDPALAAAQVIRSQDSFAPRPAARSEARTRAAKIPATAPEQALFIDEDFVDEQKAPVYNRGVTHSARLVVFLFLLVGIGFGAATLLIHNAPASAEVVLGHLPFIGPRFVNAVSPARLVTLQQVSASYQQSKDGHRALVISGKATNLGTEALQSVQLAVVLRGSARQPLASQAIYCGNSLSTGMVSQMTPHEIEFFQKLEPPRTFTLQPSTSCPFVVVFMDPPSDFIGYDVSVAQAVPVTVSMTPSVPVS